MLFDNKDLMEFVSSLVPTDSNKIKNYDLTKDEDYNEVKKLIGEARKISSDMGNWGKLLFGNSVDTLIDELEEKINKIHNESKKNVPERPSAHMTEKMAKQIDNLTEEYIDTMIRPYAKENGLTPDAILKAKDGLYEFACWIYNH